MSIPDGDPIPPGQPNAMILYTAFWEAARRTGEDETVPMGGPYFDEEMSMVDASGAGMPSQFWVHMAAALHELNVAAGTQR